VSARRITGNPARETLRGPDGRSPEGRETFGECGDERGSVLKHRCEILSIHPEAVSRTLAVGMQGQERGTA